MRRDPRAAFPSTRVTAALIAITVIALVVVTTSVARTDAATKTQAKVTRKASTRAAPKASRVATPPARRVAPKVAAATKGNGKTEVWSVSRPVVGWDRVDERDWPASGFALSAVSKRDSITVRRRPGIGEPGLQFTRGQAFAGTPTFLVLQDYTDWIMVAIPVRPNGTIGWVKTEEVERFSMVHRVVVDTKANTMIVERDGVEILRHEVATGTGNTPTPTGLFYVREVVEENPDGPYGPYVFGLSGYSNVLFSFDGGEGAIGLHGTNQPGLLGSAASFGCVRMTNQSIFNLVRMLPLGTPVEITENPASLPTTRRVRGVPDPVFVTAEVPVDAQSIQGLPVTELPDYNPFALDQPTP